PPRCLLSFPTRRSSDLGWTNGEAFDEKTNEDAQRFALWAIRNQPLDYVRVVAYDFFVRTFSWNRSQYPTIGTEARYHFPTKPDEDRKSTRLNSSHVTIS